MLPFPSFGLVVSTTCRIYGQRMNTTISQKGDAGSYEAPCLEVLGTVAELTEWCVIGKTVGTPDYFQHIPITNCST